MCSHGVSRKRCRGLVYEKSGEEREGGPEPGGDNSCESRRWSILANFVFYVVFIFSLYYFYSKRFSCSTGHLNETTNRITPVYNGDEDGIASFSAHHGGSRLKRS